MSKMNKNPSDEKRERKIIMVVGFVLFLCIAFYVYSLFQHPDANKANKEEKINLIKNSENHSTPINADNEKLVTKKPNLKKTVADRRLYVETFIEKYYSFDHTRPLNHIKSVRDDLMPAFYKELLEAARNDKNTVPYAYRKVTSITIRNEKKVGVGLRYTAAVTCDLTDDQKRKISTLDMEVTIDLAVRKGKDVVSYMTSVGKHVIKNE